MIKKIQEMIMEEKQVLVLARNRNLEKYFTQNKIGIGDTLEEISKNIFTILRKVDNYQVDLVLIEGVEKEGLGLAIMNRLLRACEYQVKEV